MKVSVVVPYRSDGGHRQRTWEWLKRRWALLGYEVVTGEPSDPSPDPGQFNRPQAINAAAAKATGDVLIVNDCDTAFDPAWVTAAVDDVCSHGGWVMPKTYLKLTQEVTETVLSGTVDAELPTGPTDWESDFAVSGLLVIPREGFETVGGFDERHRGWGWDDISFVAAMQTLWGDYRKLPGYCFHLWHPQPHEHSFGHPTNGYQQALYERYNAARFDPDAMRALLAER